MSNIIQQGNFTSNGLDKTLKIRSDADYIKIVNYTQHAAANNGYGIEYEWYKGMTTNTIMKYRPAGDQTMASNVTANSIKIIDSSSFALGANTAVTAGTNAVDPLYSTASTAGLLAGGIVRLNNTNHNNLNGLDFSVDTVTLDTSFQLSNNLATAPGRVAGAAGYYRVVAPNIEIYRMFTPSNRTIANITAANPCVVTTLVDHGYAIGQKVKFSVPSTCGMTQLNGLTGNITVVTDSTFTVDIDSSAFTAFNFPVYTAVPFNPPSVTVIGENSGYTSYMDAPGKFYNQGFIGAILAGGTTGPGGNNDDVVYWYACKSELVNNTI